MKVLLHICCAPCSTSCIKVLRGEGFDITGYWYNPNIHPYKEYENRMNALKEYSKMINLNVIYNDYYGLKEFTKNVVNFIDNRCGYCYLSRMEVVVKYAKENGYDAFTSTLFISPYQKHDMLKKTCEYLSKKYDINFLYRDFRPYFYEGKNEYRKTNLYMQKYCGCIYSEEIPSLLHQKKKKEIIDRVNRETEKKIRLSNCIPSLDFKQLKRENKEEIDFIYNIKKQKYKEECNEEIQAKIFKRYIKENVKNIKIITVKGEKIGFFDGKILEDNTFRIDNIFIIKEYQNKGIEEAISKELLFENKDIMKKGIE